MQPGRTERAKLRLVQPETRYTKSGDVSIAYQVVGDGPFDVVHVPGFVSHVELALGQSERRARASRARRRSRG